MKRLMGLTLIAGLVVVLPMSAASAELSCKKVGTAVHTPVGVEVRYREVCTAKTPQSTSPPTTSNAASEPPPLTHDVREHCRRMEADYLEQYLEVCWADDEAEPTPENPTAVPLGPLVFDAVQDLPYPAATVDIQPPGGETLVNLPTIYSTVATPFAETVVLLGQPVEIAVTPARFHWHHGDGTTQTTTTPGRPWRDDLDVTDANYVLHTYTRDADALPVTVDVVWTARYRTPGSPWLDVPGNVARTGAPTTLHVREATPHLTDPGA